MQTKASAKSNFYSDTFGNPTQPGAHSLTPPYTGSNSMLAPAGAFSRTPTLPFHTCITHGTDRSGSFLHAPDAYFESRTQESNCFNGKATRS